MARNNHQKVSCDGKEADNGLEAMKSNLVPRGRAPFGQHQESRPLARSNDCQVQRHSGFEWFCKHNRLRPEPIRLVKLDSEHAQSHGGLPVLDLARGRDS